MLSLKIFWPDQLSTGINPPEIELVQVESKKRRRLEGQDLLDPSFVILSR
jgi:hypothetical protein